jgi:uncharacterized membrane protein YdjX (TVP38/TMEM64 family)|tara:strand:+ start:6753 stop:7442 length:690 start_codon:yes stop_codon:yes gene_type:complete
VPEHKLKLPIKWIALFGVLLIVIAFVIIRANGLSGEELKALALAGMQNLQAWLLGIPLPLYIAAFIMLPALGTPVSVFYLTVAAVAGSLFGGLLTSLICIAGNCALCYWVSAGFGREFILKWVERKGMEMPQITAENHVAVTIMVRLSPLPFVLQNYGLAIGGVPFRGYMIWSVLSQGSLSAGMIIVGGSLFEGNFKYALFGLFLFFVAMVAVSWWRRRNQQKVNVAGA